VVGGFEEVAGVKFLTAFLSFLSLVYSEWVRARAKQEGRESAQEQLDANVEKAEAAVATPDPVRDERLRNRFDRSRG
jgi:hypothetical protein